ncbi:MAG: PAS domain S-box protein [Microbacter sp.]
MQKILAIDDNQDNLIVLRALLSDAFPEAHFMGCRSGREGIALAVREDPDVILLDLVMPEMDGYEVCSILKSQEETNIIPVIIVTAARTDKQSRIKALEVGADAFLTKPLDESELRVQVKTMLRIKASEVYKKNEKAILSQLVEQRTAELNRSHLAMLNLLEDLKAEIESRKKIEKALSESETHYRTLANSGQALIWIADLDQKTTFVNQIWLNFTGRTLDEELGFGWLANVHPDDVDYCLGVNRASFERRENFSIEMRLRHVDGTYHWIQNNGTPRFDSQGAFIGFIGHCLDITEHKLNEQKIVENEKLLVNIIENIPVTLIIKDPDHFLYQMINAAGEKLFDEPREHLLGKTVYDSFHLHDADYLHALDQQVVQSGVAKDSGEKEVYFKNGKKRIIHTVRVPIKDEATGRIHSLLVLSDDVTERRKMQDALQESEELYRTLLNASPEGIVILNMQQEIIELSDVMLEIFKLPSKNDLIGRNVFEFVPEREADKLQKLLQDTLSKKGVKQVEFSMKRFEGTIFPCEISTTLINEANGNPKAYMAILRDISERKEMEKQLIRTERMVSLGEMASAMAHEINQPLLSISLGVENLLLKIGQQGVIDGTYVEQKGNKIFEDIARISRLIDHVRTFSRDHNLEKPLPFLLNDSVQNALSMVSEQFVHHGIQLSVSLDLNEPYVMGNMYQFEQVVLNLLTNAKDAVEEKMQHSSRSYQMLIEVKTFHDERFNYLQVVDNGIGIQQDIIEKIMLPFFTTKEVGKGTGLGLSISYGIIKEMNGTLQVESTSNEGSVFTVSLPIVAVQQEIDWQTA